MVCSNELFYAINSSTRQLVNSSTCQLVNSSTCNLFHQFLYGSLQLSVVAIDVVLRCVINLNIGFQCRVFAVNSLHAAATNLRNTEYE